MKRSFKVTITTKKGQVMPTEERIHDAVFGCGMSWDSIKWVDVEEIKSNKKGCNRGKLCDLQKLAIVELRLTNLQIVALNEMGENIKKGDEDYFSVEDSLSEQEDEYLRAWLNNEGILVLKDEGIELRGATAEKWLKEHGKAEG